MARHSRPRRTTHTWRYSRYLIVALLALLGACAQPPANNPPTPPPLSSRPALIDQPFTLQGGKATIIERDAAGVDLKEALMIRFESVRNDSRCPVGVQCAELGDATVVMLVQIGIRPFVTLELHTSPPLQVATIAYGRYPIHLVALDPLPARPGAAITLQDYRATLLVRPELPPPPTAPSPVPPLETNAHRPGLGEKFSVQGGEMIYVDTPGDTHGAKMGLHFESISNDSRCPRLVECVVAGDAGIVLVASFNSLQQSLNLHTTPPLKQDHGFFAGYDIQLVALDPTRDRLDDTLELNQYIAHLVVKYIGAEPVATLTPIPSPQANPQHPHNALNACTLVSVETIVDQYGTIKGVPQPLINASDGSQECTIRTARGIITIRFLLGDQATAEALVTDLKQTGIPLADLARETLGRTAYGQNQRQAMLVTQSDSAIFVFGITFSDQAQPADRTDARYHLDTLQSIAYARYYAGQVEQMPKP